MCNWTSLAMRSRWYMTRDSWSPLRAQDSMVNTTSPSSPSSARKSIWPASRCRSRVASRNDAGAAETTRTGPSYGPGMRTTYSSPARIRPLSPWTLVNRANSVGATASGSHRMRSITSSAASVAPAIRAR